MYLKGMSICMSPLILWDRNRDSGVNLQAIERLKMLFQTLTLQYDFIFDVSDTREGSQKEIDSLVVCWNRCKLS